MIRHTHPYLCCLVGFSLSKPRNLSVSPKMRTLMCGKMRLFLETSKNPPKFFAVCLGKATSSFPQAQHQALQPLLLGRVWLPALKPAPTQCRCHLGASRLLEKRLVKEPGGLPLGLGAAPALVPCLSYVTGTSAPGHIPHWH